MVPANSVSFAVSDFRRKRTVNRRVVLKAAAILAGLAAGQTRPALAQGDPEQAAGAAETRGRDWFENDQLGVGGSPSGEPISIETDFPITAVGAHWRFESHPDASVEVQFSQDGYEFGELFVLRASHDAGTQPGVERTFTGLACTQASQFIRYRTLDADGNPVTLPDFGLTYIDASSGPTAEAVGSVSAASTDPSRPPRIIARWEWGANESYRFDDAGEWWFPSYRTVQHAIVHHSETSNVENPFEAIRSIQYYHAVTRGWHDIGYNYLVDRYGNIYEGRIGGQNVVGGHAYEYAWGSSGVCFIGNYIFADVSADAQAGMVAIIAWVARFLNPYARADFKSTPNLPTICGHRDVLDTTCPGDYAYDDLPAIRDLVSAALAYGGDSWPPVGIVVGDYVRVVGGVNLRSSASVGSSVTWTLADGVPGTVYDGPILADGYAWFQIATDYATGWAVANYLAVDPPTQGWKDGRFYRDSTVENTDSVTLRELPSTSASSIQSLPTGTVMSVLGGPEDANFNRWYKVQTLFGTGWVAARFLTWSDGEPPSPDPTPSGRFDIGDGVSVSDGPLNMRSSASTSGSILAQLATASSGEIIDGPQSGSGYTWYQLSTVQGKGWVVQDYLSAASEPGKFSTGSAVVVSDGPLNVRSTAGTSASIVAQAADGATGSVLAGPSSATGYTWYRVQFANNSTGWVAQDFLATNTQSNSGSTFNDNDDTVVGAGSLNLRASPSLSAAVLVRLAGGARCVIKDGPISADGYDWYQVLSGGQLGWVAGDFLVHGIQVGGSCTVYTKDGKLRLRSGAGTTYGVVAAANDGDTGSVLDGPSSANGFTWWRISTTAGTGWAAGAYLIPG